MKFSAINVDKQEFSVDLEAVALITMSGQRNSSAGWVRVDFVFKSGYQASHKLGVSDYDSLLESWNPQEQAV